MGLARVKAAREVAAGALHKSFRPNKTAINKNRPTALHPTPTPTLPTNNNNNARSIISASLTTIRPL